MQRLVLQAAMFFTLCAGFACGPVESATEPIEASEAPTQEELGQSEQGLSYRTISCGRGTYPTAYCLFGNYGVLDCRSRSTGAIVRQEVTPCIACADQGVRLQCAFP